MLGSGEKSIFPLRKKKKKNNSRRKLYASCPESAHTETDEIFKDNCMLLHKLRLLLHKVEDK